jgi:hypothetical protein
MIAMSKILRKTAIGEFFNILGSAIDAAAAVEAGRRPRSQDLQQLGIDPVKFRSIKL